MINAFSDFNTLGKIFYSAGAVGWGRAVNFTVISAQAGSTLPRFEAVSPGFSNPGAPIHLYRNNI